MKKVIVSVTNNLVTDQRIERVCQSLHQWGFDVLLVGRLWPRNTGIHRPYPFKRFKLFFNKKFLFYSEYNLRLFFFLLFHKADILLSNDLDTLPANYLAAKIKRCRLCFDSHEYFPETPEVYQRKIVRNIWLFIEQLFIKGCNDYYTVSQSVANIYYQKYGVQFRVIRNVPFRYAIPEKQNENFPFIIYQGGINMGRGLELMIQAMPFIPSTQLVIAGDGLKLKILKEMVCSFGLQDRVQFTGNLKPEKLRDLTFKASVGISIEEPLGASYISALPNKLFDYIQAGIPVLVSDLPEMKAIVNQYQIGMILEERTPENLASMLNLMINDEVKRKTWKINLTKAAQELCWENESVKLKSIFEFN